MVQILNVHLETSFNNLGYVNCTTLNSLMSGVCDCTCTFLMIYVWRWGMVGAALARIAVNSCRLIIWCILLCYYELAQVICIVRAANEPLFTILEFRVFWNLGFPQLLTYFAGWLVFELQVMGIANIQGIS